MLELIRRTAHTFGISMLLSTHLMGDIERTADRVILLEGGHVAEQGELAQFTKETADLIIEVEDRGDTVLAALAARGMDVVMEGPLIVARDVADADYDTIRDVVADSGARLRRLTPRRHTLAEIFQAARS